MSVMQSWLGQTVTEKPKKARKRKAKKSPAPNLRRRLYVEVLEARECPSVGGGFTNAGIIGDYFNNTTLAGAASFERSDVRVDFDWGTTMAPGGSTSTGFNAIGHNNFSVRWTGQIVPAFSETYNFQTTSDDGVRLFVKPTGSSTWTTVIDNWTAHSSTVDTGSFAMTAGVTYDIKMEYYQNNNAAVAKLAWSSPSTPLETIDTLTQTGINNPDLASGFADIVKGARNTWIAPSGSSTVPGMDANGWPTGDGGYVFQESLNQGLGIDPLMLGNIAFSFNGKATVSLYGNVNQNSLTYSYNAATNTTSGSFTTVDSGINASFIYFTNSHRDGTANGPGGITNLQMMRPIAPGATTSYAPGTTFDTQLEKSLSQFSLMRFQYVASQQVNWSDRTLPSFFNQANGNTTAPQMGNGQASSDGASWEYKIMLANETGRDLLISIPTLATGNSPSDTTSYIYNLALLIKYGSDQNGNPYTSAQANPVHPGLNPNLHVYLELENELWNYASIFATDYGNLNSLVTANANANNADFKKINFDNLSLAKDWSGNYQNLYIWRSREAILRMFEASDIFRSVWGDAAMMNQIRPLYEWQYDNQNNTASYALTFADDYFNNADGQNHVANPQPVSHYLWGGGGASYYSAVNSEGLTNLLPDSDFEAQTLGTAGYKQDPAGLPWIFTGTAGIARSGASAPMCRLPPTAAKWHTSPMADRCPSM